MDELLAQISFSANLAYQAHLDGNTDWFTEAVAIHQQLSSQLDAQLGLSHG